MKVNYKNEEVFLELVAGGILTVTYEGNVFNNRTGRWIGTKPNNKGYHAIGYRYGTKVIHQLVHRLVFIVHGGVLTEEFPIVNHKDLNKSNNHFENLEPSNIIHNRKHFLDLGFIPPSEEERTKASLSRQGTKGANAKLTDDEAREIIDKYRSGGFSQRELASYYNVAHATIGRLIRGTSFKYLK